MTKPVARTVCIRQIPDANDDNDTPREIHDCTGFLAIIPNESNIQATQLLGDYFAESLSVTNIKTYMCKGHMPILWPYATLILKTILQYLFIYLVVNC